MDGGGGGLCQHHSASPCRCCCPCFAKGTLKHVCGKVPAPVVPSITMPLTQSVLHSPSCWPRCLQGEGECNKTRAILSAKVNTQPRQPPSSPCGCFVARHVPSQAAVALEPMQFVQCILSMLRSCQQSACPTWTLSAFWRAGKRVKPHRMRSTLCWLPPDASGCGCGHHAQTLWCVSRQGAGGQGCRRAGKKVTINGSSCGCRRHTCFVQAGSITFESPLPHWQMLSGRRVWGNCEAAPNCLMYFSKQHQSAGSS
jgi:hypothetical protein